MFKFVLGHSKAWLFYNRFLLCLKSVHNHLKSYCFSRFSNLSRLFHCSVIKVLFVCSRQTAFVLYQSFHRLSRTFSNYFLLCFSTFFSVVRDSLFILSRGFSFVNMFFQCFFIFYKFFMSFYVKPKRRRGDLNPRAAVNDLHPFQGCPFGQLGYFSRLCPNQSDKHL